jgi:hypothetical protein
MNFKLDGECVHLIAVKLALKCKGAVGVCPSGACHDTCLGRVSEQLTGEVH